MMPLVLFSEKRAGQAQLIRAAIHERDSKSFILNKALVANKTLEFNASQQCFVASLAANNLFGRIGNGDLLRRHHRCFVAVFVWHDET